MTRLTNGVLPFEKISGKEDRRTPSHGVGCKREDANQFQLLPARYVQSPSGETAMESYPAVIGRQNPRLLPLHYASSRPALHS